MFGTLIKKEILAHVFSFRFVVVTALLLVLVPVTTLILTHDTARKVNEFSSRQGSIETYLKSYAHFNRLYGVIQPTLPPLPIFALIRGVASDINIEEFDNDPLPVMFPLLDLTFIVTLLLSLAALILTYDAVCGEKEDGTLKLMLANGLPRAKILAAKIAAGALTLAIPFVLSLFVGLFIILLNPRVSWTGLDSAALAFIILGAFVYILFFVSLAVFISSRHQSSSASIMTSLSVWVVLVLVIPNLSPYLGSIFSPAPSRIKINREVSRMQDVDRDDLGRKLSAQKKAEVLKAHPVLEGADRLSETEIKAKIQASPEFARAYETMRRENEAAWREANVIQDAKAKVLRDDLRIKEAAQTRLSKSLSMASPMADFTYWAADLSGTGLRNAVHFRDLWRAWDQLYGAYARKKMEEIQKKNPTADIWRTPVDVSDMPRFVYKDEAIAVRLKDTLAPMAVLLALTLAAGIAASLSFIRYDPR